MSDTTADKSIGNMLTATTARTTGLAKMLLAGIEPGDFASQPVLDGKPVHTNHPAWVYGHLALYPSSVMAMLGHDGSAIACPEPWQELFKNGAVCKHDPDLSTYPPMDEIVAAFETAYVTFIEAARNTTNDVLLQPAPEEGWRDAFGTNAGVVNFMIHDHYMFHLGQVSTWRRMMGLGAAM
ncbi:MAG: DinB family protein [Planctomycetota bacterium]